MRTDWGLICRYLKAETEMNAVAAKRISSVCEAMEKALAPDFVFRVFPLSETEAGIRLGEAGPILSGETAERMLDGCHSAAVLVATLGFEFERLLSASQKRDISEAVILDACASAYIETVADEAEEKISSMTDGYLTDRFSPGYGDLPLSLQPELISLTGADKRLGIHVLDSFLLNPVKTITALTGIADTPRPSMVRGCEHCLLQDTCAYKKGNGRCEVQ